MSDKVVIAYSKLSELLKAIKTYDEVTLNKSGDTITRELIYYGVLASIPEEVYKAVDSGLHSFNVVDETDREVHIMYTRHSVDCFGVNARIIATCLSFYHVNTDEILSANIIIANELYKDNHAYIITHTRDGKNISSHSNIALHMSKAVEYIQEFSSFLTPIVNGEELRFIVTEALIPHQLTTRKKHPKYSIKDINICIF